MSRAWRDFSPGSALARRANRAAGRRSASRNVEISFAMSASGLPWSAESIVVSCSTVTDSTDGDLAARAERAMCDSKNNSANFDIASTSHVRMRASVGTWFSNRVILFLIHGEALIKRSAPAQGLKPALIFAAFRHD